MCKCAPIQILLLEVCSLPHQVGWGEGGASLGAPSHRISAKRATTLTNNGEGKMGKKREREREAYEEVYEMRELAHKVA